MIVFNMKTLFFLFTAIQGCIIVHASHADEGCQTRLAASAVQDVPTLTATVHKTIRAIDKIRATKTSKLTPKPHTTKSTKVVTEVITVTARANSGTFTTIVTSMP